MAINLTQKIQIQTPCGPIGVTIPLVIPIPPIPSLPLSLPFPPRFRIPLPDCSLLKHTGSAPEPPEDSHP